MVNRSIEHVVVLMLENRSFDQLLGTLPGIDGIQNAVPNPHPGGPPVAAFLATDPAIDPSPRHDLVGVLDQLSNGNTGFVRNYETVPGVIDGSDAMAYYDGGDFTSPVSVLQHLATSYAVSDRYFCSVPAETWPNRFFVHAATSDGHVKNDVTFYLMPTIFDLLEHRFGNAPSWSVYCDSVPQVSCITRLGLEWVRTRGSADGRFRTLRQFRDDCRADTLPPYAFIEPTYLLPDGDDDHPPHDLFKGEALIRQVYSALFSSPAWTNSVLIVTFDEHGGFSDHVPPPDGVPAPDDRTQPAGTAVASVNGFSFHSLGPRVPFVLIAPGLSLGAPFHPPDRGFFDHTSILATLERLWGLSPLTARDAAAADFLGILGSESTVINPMATDDLNAISQGLLTEEHRAHQEGPTPLDPAWRGWSVMEEFKDYESKAGDAATDLGKSMAAHAVHIALHAAAVALDPAAPERS